jgi:hypothetical protein
MKIILKLLWMAFEVGGNNHDHLVKQNLTVGWWTGSEFGLEKRLEIHDCPDSAKAYGRLPELLAGIF